MLGAARRRSSRQRDLSDDVVAEITAWTPRVGVGLACAAFGVRARTWRHRRQAADGRLSPRRSRATGVARRSHPAKLTPGEEAAVLDALCSERFVDVGVAECWASLLDDGTYLCSESTMHRILREHGLSGQRRQHDSRGGHPKPRVVATAPNMVWVWDISRLPGPRRGVWFYLYVIWDLWSRKAIGWCVDTAENADIAEKLITVTCGRERIDRHQLSSIPTAARR